MSLNKLLRELEENYLTVVTGVPVTVERRTQIVPFIDGQPRPDLRGQTREALIREGIQQHIHNQKTSFPEISYRKHTIRTVLTK